MLKGRRTIPTDVDIRVRKQIKLISDMEEHIEEMKKIVEKYI